MDYLGNDTINDVDVDVWNGCIYIKNTDMTLNATYYFSGLCSEFKTIQFKNKNMYLKIFSIYIF